MKTHILPLGAGRWEGKKRIIRELIATRQQPPFIYNDVLILVASARLKRRYGRLLLESLQDLHHARCLVQPDVQTLPQFVQRQYATLQAPRLIDEQSRLVLLEGLVKERLSGAGMFGQRADLLAPSLSSVLAKTVEQLAHAGITPEALSDRVVSAEFGHKPQVALLGDVYAAYVRALGDKNLIDPAGMRYVLRDRFDETRLPYRMVILDGIIAEGVEAEIVQRIARCTDCRLIVEAPSLELVRRARESHPLRLLRDFLENVGLLDAEPLDMNDRGFSLAEALFADEPFAQISERVHASGEFSGTIRLLPSANTREEVSLIARQVKESLRNGMSPDSILVSFPALDEYAPLVEELFGDYGIPYNRALGRQLGTSAVTTAVISLLRAAQDDFSAPSLLRVFSSPFLKFGEQQELAPSVDRFLRERNMTGGRDRLLAALKYDVSTKTPAVAVRELINELEPFRTDESGPLTVWTERLSKLLAWSGLAGRVAAIRGPLNINLQAYKKLDETLHSLAAAGRTFPEYCYTFSEWLFLLRKTFMHARFQVPPEDEGGVQVLGLEESLSLPWNEIYLGGMIDAKFPQRLPQNIFLPERMLEAMGIRTLERARLKASYQFYRLLLSAGTVTLSWPEQDGDKPVVPSPFLKELEPLQTAGFVNKEMPEKSDFRFSLWMQDGQSVPELAKALALAAPEERRELHDQLARLPEPAPEIAGRIRVLLQADRVPAAAVPVPCLDVHDFRVTDLDIYLACPYDYYITRILGIEPLEEVSDDLSPLDRGSKVHAILRDFYRSWSGPVTRENREQALALLVRLAGTTFAVDAETFRNRRIHDLFRMIMAERFVDSEIGFWTGGMRPGYLEKSVEHYPLLLSNGASVHLSGKIDRIDLDSDGSFIVVDYKTGTYPLPRQTGDQDIFQLPIYAVMAKRLLSDSDPPLRKPVGLAYYDLAGKTGGGARDMVLFDRDAGNDHPCSKPKASPKSAVEFEEILQQSLAKARSAVEGILAGNFPATPRDDNRCRFCASQVVCRRDEGD